MGWTRDRPTRDTSEDTYFEHGLWVATERELQRAVEEGEQTEFRIRQERLLVRGRVVCDCGVECNDASRVY